MKNPVHFVFIFVFLTLAMCEVYHLYSEKNTSNDRFVSNKKEYILIKKEIDMKAYTSESDRPSNNIIKNMSITFE